MKILSKKKVSFAIRLKELMQEQIPPMTQEELAGKLRNPAYKDNPPFNPHTISSWFNGGSLRRFKKDILQQLADIFDVDPAYLDCTQIERHKSDMHMQNVDAKKLADDIKRLETFTAYLESIGIKYYFASNYKTEINEYLDAGYIYTVEEAVGNETEITLTLDDKSISLSESEWNKKMQDLEKYTKFFLFN